MKKIDAHMHYYGDHPDVIDLMERMNLKFLNICVVHENEAWREQADVMMELTTKYPGRYAWCTGFDLPDFNDPDYAEKVVADLDKDFRAGAVACKIWKNVGMSLKTLDGAFLMMDNTVFDPIFAHMAKSGMPLVAHIGEPLACWQVLVPGTPHCEYYRNNPQWHMYNRPEFPSHQEIIAARDRVLEKHPKLKVIGAHLGSLEYDVSELAERFERYPNFAADTSARLVDLAYQDSGKVREFILKYQDRLLFGTDMVVRQRFSGMTDDERQRRLEETEKTFRTAFAYYETSDKVSVSGRMVKGLGLPETVLEKFYCRNAETWFPGVCPYSDP